MNQRKLAASGFFLIGWALPLLACDPARAQEAVTMQSEAADAAEAKILRLLEGPVSLDFREQSLEEVMNYLSDSIGLPIQFDLKALEDASIGPDLPVTCELPSMTVRSALSLLLGRLDLTWVIKNEVLLITTPEKAGNELITRVYPVHDLVVWRSGDRTVENYQHLIDMITATIAPTTWDEVGGPGSIHEFRPSAALVVSETREVHEQIVPLLAAVRQARDLQNLTHDRLAAAQLTTSGGTGDRRSERTGALRHQT